MSFKAPFPITKTISSRTIVHSHTMVGLPARNILYKDRAALKKAIKEALIGGEPGPALGDILGATDLSVLTELEAKGQPSNRDIQNFLRLPNNIIKDDDKAGGCEAIAKNFFLAIIQATPAENAHIITLFKKGFYGLSSHPKKADREQAVQSAELAQKAFSKHFSLFLNAFINAPADDILWKRFEEFLRIVILPLSCGKPKEAAALAGLDPATFAEEIVYRIGQEWAGDHSARFDDRRSKIWGMMAATLIKSLCEGPVHQMYNNDGLAENPALVPHFMLLALLENHPAIAPALATTLGLTLPNTITGREKSLTRQQLLPLATGMKEAFLKSDRSAEELFNTCYSACANKLFVSPSQAGRATSGLTQGLSAFHE